MNAYKPLLAITLALAAHSSGAAEPVRFNRDVLPILADKCFHCHGPDSARRKANLRLDREDEAKRKREEHFTIVANKPEQSELIRRIEAKDDERMPPKGSGRELSKEQAETLRRWIAEGAKWEQHWAFIPPTSPATPSVKDANWSRNPIDYFILTRLEQAGLRPSSEAERTTLIRRMSFDLTGLPPTPEEIDAFVRDKSPNAIEKLADRLLASPRYGERMAWRWLEAARYADTNGYQTDAERDMYRWRDWVIGAYNRNLPFDQFTIEQLAGDLLPSPTLDQRIATGFNRNHRGNAEGGIVPEEYAVEYVADRVETTSTVWLGLTLGCARCHDHKFDPFTQKEFYQLFAFFNNVPEKGRAVKYGNSPPYIQAPTREQESHLKLLKDQIDAAEKAVNDLGLQTLEAMAAWEKDPGKVPDWSPDRGRVARWPLDNGDLPIRGTGKSRNGRIGKAIELDGKSFVDAGNSGDFGFDDRFSLSFWIHPAGRDGTLISRMVDEPRADGYSVQLVNGKVQVHLTKRWLDDALRVESHSRVKLNDWTHIGVTYDATRSAAGVQIYINGLPDRTNVLLDELNQTFATKEPLRIGGGNGPAGRFRGAIDEVQVFARTLSIGDMFILATHSSIQDILQTPARERRENEVEKLRAFYFQNAAPKTFRDAFESFQQAQETHRKYQASLPTVMVMEEMPKPRDSFVLLRGQYDQHGEKVAASLPKALPAKPATNRLDLAKWLVSAENPLTARVAVNRIWQLHFGVGLVKTGEDFGTQGEFPSHPELLDGLATEFVRTGWDQKRLHKLIVTSATYRQSSSNPQRNTSDPDNRPLSRFPRYRFSAEMIRDQALFASGLLVQQEGGPSVKPYQPAGLWDELSGAGDYVPDKGDKLYRRGLYTYWKRTVPPPGLSAFDAFARETCWVRETRTNTPIQALTMLNDVTYVEASRKLAERVMREVTQPDVRLALAFQRITSRKPTDRELAVLKRGLEHHAAEYRKDPARVAKLLSLGEAKVDKALNAAELAALAEVCRMILNLDESVTKE
jgi:hypothetical protein